MRRNRPTHQAQPARHPGLDEAADVGLKAIAVAGAQLGTRNVSSMD